MGKRNLREETEDKISLADSFFAYTLGNSKGR